MLACQSKHLSIRCVSTRWRLVCPAADDDFVLCQNAPCGQALILPSQRLVSCSWWWHCSNIFKPFFAIWTLFRCLYFANVYVIYINWILKFVKCTAFNLNFAKYYFVMWYTILYMKIKLFFYFLIVFWISSSFLSSSDIYQSRN